MKFGFQKLLFVVLLACVWSAPTSAYTCKGGNFWNKLPAATKQKLTARANKQPYTSGRYFRIERNGRVSYLLGTIHVPPIKQLKLPAHVMKTVQKSKRVYVEKSKKEFSAFSKMIKENRSYLYAQGLNGFSKYFSAAEWKRVREAMEIVGWSKSAAETLRPWYILDEIEGIGCGMDHEGFLLSLDSRVMRVAARYKVPVIGLETPAKVDAYYRALSEKKLAVMIKSLPIMHDNYPYGGSGKALLGLFGAEEIVLAEVLGEFIDQQFTEPKGAKMRADFTNQKILLARNKAWMPALTQAFNAGGSFVAVGAAHLGGSYGLLPMLQRKGFKITRIPLK